MAGPISESSIVPPPKELVILNAWTLKIHSGKNFCNQATNKKIEMPSAKYWGLYLENTAAICLINHLWLKTKS